MEKAKIIKREISIPNLSRINSTLNTSSATTSFTDRSNSGNFQGPLYGADLSPIKLNRDSSQVLPNVGKMIDECILSDEFFNLQGTTKTSSSIRKNLRKICMQSKGISGHLEDDELESKTPTHLEENFLNNTRRRKHLEEGKINKEANKLKLVATPISKFQDNVYREILNARFPADSIEMIPLEAEKKFYVKQNKENLGYLNQDASKFGLISIGSNRKIIKFAPQKTFSGDKKQYNNSCSKNGLNTNFPPTTPIDNMKSGQNEFHSDIKDCRVKLQHKINSGYSNKISYERDKIPHLRGKVGGEIKKSYRVLFKDF